MVDARLASRAGFLTSLAIVAIACSFGSLDELKKNAGQDGGAGGPDGPPASCISGGDCTGCQNCDSWCGCKVPPAAFDQCMSTCPDGGFDSGSGTGGGSSAAGLVSCGGQSCSISAGLACCQAAYGSSQWSCHSVAADCGGTEVSCDGPEDCPANQVCCARMDSNGHYNTLLCGNDCVSPNRVVCASSTSCPSPTSCKTSSLPYLLCQ